MLLPELFAPLWLAPFWDWPWLCPVPLDVPELLPGAPLLLEPDLLYWSPVLVPEELRKLFVSVLLERFISELLVPLW
jgi:hypothetical protein